MTSMRADLTGIRNSILSAAANAVDQAGNQWTRSSGAAADKTLSQARANQTSLTRVFDAADKALAAVSESTGQASIVANDARFDRAYKNKTISKLIDDAHANATAALADVETTCQSVHASLAAAILPQAPKGVSEDMILDRKRDLERILANGAGRDWSVALTQVQKLYREALETGDDLSAYVLAGGPLKFFYQAQGFNAATIGAQLANVKAANERGVTGASGAQLLYLLSIGGPGTLGAFLAIGRHLVDQDALIARSTFLR